MDKLYSKKKILYLFSSITFLQFYIPLVIEFNKNNFDNIFIIRENSKLYACPVKNEKNKNILNKFQKKYKFMVIESKSVDFNKLSGIIFMIDGDIYGPNDQNFKESLIHKLNEKTIKISLTEHMNYKWVYNKYIDKVNYSIFANKNFTNQFNFNSNKNIYLGNTKYDNIMNEDEVYKKYKLDKNNKYCLLLYPRHIFHKTKYTTENIQLIYEYLDKLNYKIIVKTRPKDNNAPDKHKGYRYVCSDTYPNESLELMKVCDLCIIFSSSANEETIFSQIPCLDLQIDFDCEAHNFLLDDKIYKRIKKWKNINYEQFNDLVNSLENKNSKYFEKVKEKYLFTHNNTSKKIFDFLKEKHPENF